jgi:hypothetical protein
MASCPLPHRRKNFEDFFISWLDANLKKTDDDDKNTFIDLRKHVNKIEIFDNSEECVDFITDVEHVKVLLIVSGSFGQPIVPLIYNLSQISSIYVFCVNVQLHQTWSRTFSKVTGEGEFTR